MKRENFYRRDPSAALAGMVSMTLEERGVYNTILDLLYLTWRPVEDDRRYIAGHCGCAVQKLNPLVARLIAKGKLIRFEDGGLAYISEANFEAERLKVKGVSTPSGRGEVGEKSVGVEKNPPTCPENVSENQTFAALDKTREDKKEDTPIAPKGATVDFDVDRPKVRKGQKPASSPSPEALAIWTASPVLARQRSSLAETDAELAAAVRRGHSHAQVAAGLAAAYGSTVYAGEHAKGVHRLIAKDRWKSFDPGPIAEPRAAWTGPAELRAWIVAETTEAFALAYVDPTRWDKDTRRLIAPNAYSAAKLRDEAALSLARGRVFVATAAEVGADIIPFERVSA